VDRVQELSPQIDDLPSGFWGSVEITLTERSHQWKEPGEKSNREREVDALPGSLRPHTQHVGCNQASHDDNNHEPNTVRTQRVLQPVADHADRILPATSLRSLGGDVLSPRYRRERHSRAAAHWSPRLLRTIAVIQANLTGMPRVNSN
jgi:hypothetical protein